MKTNAIRLAAIIGVLAFALTVNLTFAQTTGTTNNNSMYSTPNSGLTDSTSGTLNSSSTTSGSATGTVNGTVNGTTGTTDTTNPGLPNTGVGGDAFRNMMVVLASTIVAIIGATFLVKRLA